MAISSEQDSAVTNSDEVKVIAIKLPFDLQERILSFPFLHLIREKYPEAEIHFITPKKQIEVLNLLPFTAFYHEFDEDEIENIFDVHRYTATAKIYNVDLFISLTNSFSDACLGLGLRAKKRLGFSDGWKTMVLTHKTPRPVGHHITDDFLALYHVLVGGVTSSRLKVLSREVAPVIPEWDTQPYLAINLCPITHAGIEDDIIELINLFEDQRIVLFAAEDQEKIDHLIAGVINRLNKKNTYINYVHKSWIDLAKVLAFSRGVITFNGPLASFSSYVGARSVVLFDTEDPQKHGPLYFLGENLMLNVNDPNYGAAQTSKGVLKNKRRFRMLEVFGASFEFFKMIMK
jgi:ADP-heptose:LPS heptosyltransferase